MTILEHTSIWIDDDGILCVKYHDHCEIDVAYAQQHVKEVIKICGPLPRLFLIDMRNVFGNISSEAREYIATNKDLRRLRSAQALVVNNLGIRLIANFYLKINQPPGPKKMFSSVEEASQWLKTISVGPAEMKS